MTTLITYKDTASKQTGKELLKQLAISNLWKNAHREILETSPHKKHRYHFIKATGGACTVFVTYMRTQTLYKFIYTPKTDALPELGYVKAMQDQWE